MQGDFFKEDKEIVKLDLGQFDWIDYLRDGYLFLCSSDKGALIINGSTGEVVLKIPEASTLYSFEVPEGLPYFTALYLSDNGETRLDVYDQENLSSKKMYSKGKEILGNLTLTDEQREQYHCD